MIEWNYAHDADITIGEVHISKTAKILLILLIIGLIILAGVAIYFREYIHDYIANPSIVLREKEVNLEVHTEFKPEDYIANDTSGYTYEILGADFKTDELGSYTVTYNSKNKVKQNTTELKVNIVDTTPPEITLTKELDLLVRGEDTDNFKAHTYLKKVTDNYSDKTKIIIDYTTDIDFSKDTVQIIFSATDENGNVATKTLNLAIFASPEELEQAEVEAEQQENNDNPPQNDDRPDPPATEAPATEAPTTEAPQPQGRSISGVHNVTKSWSDTSWTLQSAFMELQTGVSCTGDSVQLTGLGTQISGPGTYTFTWVYSSDGAAAATCYIYITE